MIESHPKIRLPQATGGRWILVVLNTLLGISGAVAIATFILLHGGWEFSQNPFFRQLLLGVQKIIVGVFILDRIVRFILAKSRWGYLKSNWIDVALILGLILAITVISRSGYPLLTAGALYVVITQVYLLVAISLRAISANARITGVKIPPGWVLMASFAGMAIVGSGLLMLPAAIESGRYAQWSYPDALFTATSATCVTGLVVADTGKDFTMFGQMVILVLIQLGGLGIMMFGTLLGLLVGKSLTMRGSENLGKMFFESRIGDIRHVVKFVVLATLLFEIIGAGLLYPMFSSHAATDAFGEAISQSSAVWYSVFHSISAFCNAGFSLYPDNFMHGIESGASQPLRNHWEIMGVIAPLIIFGGLGFPVLSNCCQSVKSRLVRMVTKPKSRPVKLHLHSKIVLGSTVALIIFGAVGLWLAELPYHGDEPASGGGQVSATQQLRQSLFQSVSARTAGFNTIDMAKLTNAGKLWLCGLMTIGGSPAGTAGGIKTVTFVLLIISAWCVLRRRGELEAFGRSIPESLLRKAATLVLFYAALVFAITMLLSVNMRNESLIDILFEACSACGTVGFTTGITGRLDTFGKTLITFGMLVGRVGPLTLVVALAARVKSEKYTYPRENVLIG